MKPNDLDPALYGARRARLALAMQGGVAVVPTAPERIRNRDTHYPYRYDSHFYYLTGFPEPEAVLVLVAGPQPRSLLFCREKDAERETWDGFRFGPRGAQERFGFDEAHPIAALDAKLVELLGDQPALHYPVGADAAWDARAIGWLNALRAQSRSGIAAPERVQDVRALVDEMRLVKDAHEVGVMRRAATISAAAHRRAIRAARPGRFEYELEADLLHEFRRSGAQFPAYWPIVAGGANACVLHYVSNDDRLRDGDLVLIDAGCELAGYASDITRTFPVGARFSAAQREVYEIVLASQAAAIDKVRAGNAWNEPHDAAVRVLAQGMLDLKLLAGSLDEVLEKETYKRFYMHRTGHWLGLDVHDAGDYKRAGKWRTLAPGMVLTVEPGLYIRAADDVPERLHGIGIRIEDDALVTDGACDILTAEAPKSVAEIEALKRDAASIAVRGAGPAGCVAALLLQRDGHAVALQGEEGAGAARRRGALRPLALSHASRLILERVGAWGALAPTPIADIHVSQQGGFGRTRMSAAEAGVPALGYVVDYGALLEALRARVARAGIDFVRDGGAAALQVHAEGTPQEPGEKDYRQAAVVALVATRPGAATTAWERFTPEGPLALLPLAGRYCTVWGTRPERASELCDMPEADFLAALRLAFGRRAGEFTALASERGRVPLALRVRASRIGERAAYIGNAAQTLHPVAGQGLNLGLRDAWDLALVLRGAEDPGAARLLERYAAMRRIDAAATVRVTDFLAGAFLDDGPLQSLARGFALTALDICLPARRFFARRMIFGASALP